MSEEELRSQVKTLQDQITQLTMPAKPNINAVSVKLSAFWPDKPHLWFAQAEAQFEIAGISKDSTKYGHLLSILDARLADEVEDIIANPPAEDKYEHLKSELIKRFSISREQRIRHLLSQQEMGDRKPSSFLRHLRSLAGKSDEGIIRELWMRSLPHEVQRILMAQLDLPLDKVANLADAITEAAPSKSVNATHTSHDLEKIMQCINDLSKKVDALSKDRARSSSRSNSRSQGTSRSRDRSASRSNKKLCWYHDHYGKKAAKCTQPCEWTNKSENTTSNQ